VENNPYQLTYDIWGIGFKTADQIAGLIGFKPEDPRRIDAGVVHILNEAVTRGGNTFLYRQDLVASASEILDSNGVESAISRLAANGQIVVETYDNFGERMEAIYPPSLHRAEVDVSEQIKRIAAGRALEFDEPVDPETIDVGGALTEQQKGAVITCLTQPVVIVTGGPGVGKTTTTRAIVTAFDARKKRVLLASPTGRAAKRLAEVTGREARTLHRLLEYDPTTRGFKRNNQNPLQCDLLVIDEASMLDINLIDSLLAAVPEGAHLLFIGDVDQLPSVGPGNVLRDLIESGAVPVARLTQIFRQAEASRIVTNAHLINHGEMPVLSLPSQKEDFVYIDSEHAEEAAAKAVAVVARSLPNRGYSPSDIQVLTPMQKGDAGAVNLNIRLQSALNPAKDGQGTITRGGRTFREGDRVMQVVNNYDRSVYNGDIGTIKTIDTEEGKLVVQTPEADVSYEFSDLDELVLAYATTIHKSQGSEFPVVVVLVHMQHYILLQRNLIYTALTRARKLAVFVGSKQAIRHAVRTQSEIRRNTRLKLRLQGLV
jgi:exodeoxyribonuclease V alpha subunit